MESKKSDSFRLMLGVWRLTQIKFTLIASTLFCCMFINEQCLKCHCTRGARGEAVPACLICPAPLPRALWPNYFARPSTAFYGNEFISIARSWICCRANGRHADHKKIKCEKLTGRREWRTGWQKSSQQIPHGECFFPIFRRDAAKLGAQYVNSLLFALCIKLGCSYATAFVLTHSPYAHGIQRGKLLTAEQVN